MPKDISFMQYMRAHGNTPGPTQRPLLTGAISGLIAAAPALLVLHYSNALGSIAENLGIGFWPVLAGDVGFSVLSGVIYAALFRRAANDRQGGWLFGISYGFLLWMLGPTTLWQLITSRPVAVGTAAMGLFGAEVLFGLVLGFVYPWIHQCVQMRLRDAPGERPGQSRKIDMKSARERAESHLKLGETKG